MKRKLDQMSTTNPQNFLNVQLLGMVNALKTGDPTVDLLLAMALPYLATYLSKDITSYLKLLFARKPEAPDPVYERKIMHRSAFTNGGGQIDVDTDNYNLILIKAIQLYVHKTCKLELREADVCLTTLGADKNPSSTGVRPRGRVANQSMSAWLQTFDMVECPKPQQWLDIGEFEGHTVTVYMEDSIGKSESKEDKSEGGGGKGIRTLAIRVKSKKKGSIAAFLTTAYNWYVQQLKDGECNDRYFLDLRSFDSGSFPTYRRYKLGDEKTFDSLFSRQCHDLLKIVDQFETKSGKYAIKGYPHKLGLLLTGPPGTGKTSLIKALAHYTNRHIVNILLNRITTNADLMGVLFNKKYQLNDTGALTNLDFDRVIFVFEDVDATSDVVKDRSLLEAERAEKEEEKKRRKKEKESDASGTGTGGTARRTRARISSVSTRSDALNLTGLLNALDGVVESPGRIVIMTSNHPEVLDRALIRPGRIDKILQLGYMVAADIVAMLEHYYQEKLSEDHKARVVGLLGKGMEITAARLEQLTIEESTVSGLISLLEENHTKENMIRSDSCSTTEAGSLASGSSEESEAVAGADCSSAAVADSLPNGG